MGLAHPHRIFTAQHTRDKTHARTSFFGLFSHLIISSMATSGDVLVAINSQKATTEKGAQARLICSPGDACRIASEGQFYDPNGSWPALIGQLLHPGSPFDFNMFSRRREKSFPKKMSERDFPSLNRPSGRAYHGQGSTSS